MTRDGQLHEVKDTNNVHKVRTSQPETFYLFSGHNYDRSYFTELSNSTAYSFRGSHPSHYTIYRPRAYDRLYLLNNGQSNICLIIHAFSRVFHPCNFGPAFSSLAFSVAPNAQRTRRRESMSRLSFTALWSSTGVSKEGRAQRTGVEYWSGTWSAVTIVKAMEQLELPCRAFTARVTCRDTWYCW